MSLANLLIEVRDALRDSLEDHISNPINNIRIRLSGQPTPTSGEVFVAVHAGNWNSPEDLSQVLKDEIEVVCTITIRSRKYPEDRDPDYILVGASKSLSDLSDRIVASIHGNTSVSSSAGRIEPLRWVSCVGPIEQTKSWFYSDDPNDADTQPAGYSMDVIFRGALRVRTVPCN